MQLTLSLLFRHLDSSENQAWLFVVVQFSGIPETPSLGFMLTLA